MSMLAERKRKAKWITLSSKKPLWDTDAEGIKFGKELMEKMGWSAGKGLGVNEQGITEPLKVSHKVDTKGVGYKGNEENWTKQQDEFDHLLSQLSSSINSNNSSEEFSKTQIKSLEEKSKKSRTRVHYQKFTRGKDLSRYNDNDLACILGTSKLTKQNNLEKENEPEIDKTEKSNENSFGFKTINSGSLEDYFKKKWLNKKNNKSIDDSESKLQLNDNCSTEVLEQKERLHKMVPSQNFNNLNVETEKNSETPQSVKKCTPHLSKSELVEEKNLEKHLHKKKKKKDKEFTETVKKSKKNMSKCEPSVELQKTDKINVNSLNNLLAKNSGTESDTEYCKIRSETSKNDSQIDKKNSKKGKKQEKQKNKIAEISSKNTGVMDSVASQFVDYGDNNLEEKHLKKFKNHKQKLKEKINFKTGEDKNKEIKLKKGKIYDTNVNEKNSDNESQQSEKNKGRIKNKKSFKLEDICDENKVNLKFNSEDILIMKKHKKSKKKKTDLKVENEEEGNKDFNGATTENQELHLNSAIENLKKKHVDSKLSKINKNIKTLDQENNGSGESQVFISKHENKEILEKTENELHNDVDNFTALPLPNNKVIYSIHTHKKMVNYNKIIKLMYGASIDKFVGSNLSGLPGYGTFSTIKNVNKKTT